MLLEYWNQPGPILSESEWKYPLPGDMMGHYGSEAPEEEKSNVRLRQPQQMQVEPAVALRRQPAPLQINLEPFSSNEEAVQTPRQDILGVGTEYSGSYDSATSMCMPNLYVHEKKRSKSEADKESVTSPMWRNYPSPESVFKYGEGESPSSDRSSGSPDVRPRKSPPIQNFKKYLRARYESSQEGEGLCDADVIKDDKEDDAVFAETPEKDKPEVPVPMQIPIPSMPLRQKSASVSGTIPEQMEPLDLSRPLFAFQAEGSDAGLMEGMSMMNVGGSATHRFPYRDYIYSDMTAVSPVPVSPRWTKPHHTQVPSPLAYSHASSAQHLLPSPVPSPSPGLSPRFSPAGLSPPTFHSASASSTGSSPQDFPMRSSSASPNVNKGTYPGKFIFPPPADMLDTRDGKFSCLVCNQIFPSYDNLAKHMAKHLPTETVRSPDNSKIHYCKVCNRAFSRSDMLTRHMRLHTGLKPYQCGVCGQVFSRSDHLNTHARTHSGLKPYRCPQCPYAACRRDMITRHMRIHFKRWTKRPAYSSTSSEESPRHWSVSSTESGESSEQRMSISSLEGSEVDRSPRVQTETIKWTAPDNSSPTTVASGSPSSSTSGSSDTTVSRKSLNREDDAQLELSLQSFERCTVRSYDDDQ